MTSDASIGDAQLIKSDCILCVSGCGIDAYVKDGKLVKVAGMQEHPLNKGKLCPRGENLVEYANAGDRLKYPMKKENDEWNTKKRGIKMSEENCYNCGAEIKKVYNEFTRSWVLPSRCPNCGRCLGCD